MAGLKNKKQQIEQDNTLKDTGRICREFREECVRISQRQFAKKWGVDFQQIQRFEAGKSNNAYTLLLYIREGLL